MTTIKKKILLIEDEESHRLCLGDFLRHCGYRCEVAKHGAEGLVKLQTTSFDLVITDLNMPVMTGYQFLDALQGNPTLQHIPVLITTGECLGDIQPQITSIQVHDILLKPYDFPILSQRLKTLLS